MVACFAGLGLLSWTLGDRSVDFSSQVVTVSDQLGTDQNVAHFGYEAHEWMFRLTFGIRFQWLGFEE